MTTTRKMLCTDARNVAIYGDWIVIYVVTVIVF